MPSLFRNSAHTQALKDYNQWIVEHPDAAGRIQHVITEALDDAGISYDQVSIRIKDRRSYASKLSNTDYPEYTSFNTAHDIIGARITTYHTSEFPQVKSVISDLFDVEQEIDKSAQTAQKGTFGYSSQHLIARIRENTSELEDLAGQIIEVQLRTVLQHAWAEFEHDIRYKNPQQKLSPEIQRAFTLSAGLVELADKEFDRIAAQLAEPDTETAEEDEADELASTELSAQSLPGVLTMLLGPSFPMSKAQYYSWALDMLAANGITTIGELQHLITEDTIATLQDRMDYRYNPGQVRLLDDLLLMTYGRDHISRTVHIGQNTPTRSGRLGNRWKKLSATPSDNSDL